MAMIRFEGQEKEVSDGSRVMETCEELGVPFGCHDGICGTCMSTVVEGMDNLESMNDKEEDMGLADGQRLCCQCVIKNGVVEFSLD
jgi:ferredoxin